MFLRLLRNVFLFTAVSVAVLLFAPGLPPQGVEFTAVTEEEPRLRAEGVLANNSRLDEARRLTTDVDEANYDFFDGPGMH